MNHDRSLVAAVFPDRSVDSISVTRAGNSKRTIAVWFESHDPVVLQCSSETSLRTEGELGRAIRDRTTAPVPRVIEIGTHDTTSYVVTELARGENLHSRFAQLDRHAQRRIAWEFGRYLAELHESFVFDGFGEVTCSSTGEEVEFRAIGAPDFHTWFRRYSLEGVEALPAEFDAVREELRRAIEAGPTDPVSDPVLYPWDFRPGNALARDGVLSAVLDWGDPLGAPAGLSVAKTDHLLTDWYLTDADADPVRTAYRNGYESVQEYPPVPPLYRLVAIIRSAVDSKGIVTRPRYPEWTGQRAVEFHLTRLRNLLTACNPA